MSISEVLARIEHPLRSALVQRLSPAFATRLYACSRKRFLDRFAQETPPALEVPASLKRTLWGLEFRSPILNAAGIFKEGFGAALCHAQGAGGFLAGTCTAGKRLGNSKLGVVQPFAPLPHSQAALNWLGLPNSGARQVAEQFRVSKKGLGFPCGMSVAASAEIADAQKRLDALLESLAVVAAADADFIELNESCPNTEVRTGSAGQDELVERLTYIAQHFLRQRTRSLPVVVKFSCDTSINAVPELLRVLLELGFDGVNFGNTSTRYAQHRSSIQRQELALFDYFTENFGGGLSGAPLRGSSLALLRAAKTALSELRPTREFHLWSTGGVQNAKDIAESFAAGASLVQWYSGYFEQFSRYGHGLYGRLYAELEPLLLGNP